MKHLILLAVFVSFLGGLGCAGTRVTEEDKDVVWQNYQGSKVIVETTNQPEVAVIAEDLHANSETLVKNFGEPKKKVPYSTEASAAARKASEESHAQGWFMMGLTGLIGVGLPVLINRFAPGLGGLVSNMLGGIFKSRATKTAEATMAGIEQYIRSNPTAGKVVEGFLHRAQKKLGVDSLAGKILGHVKSNVLPELPASTTTPPSAPAPPPSGAPA